MISRSQNRRRRGGNRGGNRPNTPNKGNAAQLLDKYKGLARDAQMSGDRVQQEYYLQFADHYFRVLEEFNAKKEEQQQQRGGSPKGKQQQGDDNQSNDQQQDKPKRQPRKRKDEQAEDGQQDKPKRATRKPKKDENDGGEAIADALPPAIGGDEEDEAA
ncbi:DUF4167 domain-containing protein [Sphingomicrobium clamense]|uniref:DUF4167 domain-containing protein n=1 Tax=Sphingomicrobium clamense TaxID=2851013 RepID=UPI00210227CB|nr:DUF4167 domain-containing protein [Sphingomicrobium sp. B8]